MTDKTIDIFEGAHGFRSVHFSVVFSIDIMELF